MKAIGILSYPTLDICFHLPFWGEGGLVRKQNDIMITNLLQVCSSFNINLLVWDSQLRHKRMRNIWVTSCDYGGGGGSQNMLRKLNQVFNSMNYMCCTLIFFNCTCILYLFLKWLFWYCPLLWYNLMIKKSIIITLSHNAYFHC